MASTQLSARRLGRATLARQMLLERAEMPAARAVERLAGMQAQEPRPPYAGLWARLTGFRREDLHDALHAREVVRATLMRATLHLMSADDFRALRPALDPMMRQSMGPRTRGLDLDEVLAAARPLLEEEPRTFNELRALLAEAFPKADDRGLGRAVRLGLPLVMVPTDDRWGFSRDSRFALADGWLRKRTSRSGKPDELILRYLAAFGPATPADVQAWSGLKGVKAVMEGLRPKLETLQDERGRELFDLPDAPRPDEDVPAPPRFLPDFDNLVLAHDDRSRVIDDEHRPLVATKNLRIRATFLVDGRVRGTWTVARKGKRATLTLAPFARLAKRDAAALTEEGRALVAFLEEDAASFDVRVG
jgi:Winged helix DNA-binding domain